MATMSVVVKEIADLQRRYRGSEAVVLEELDRGVTRIVLSAENAIKTEIDDPKTGAKASGALMQSISHRVENIAGGVRGIAGPNARNAGEAATAKNYAINVIKGRRPGKRPPIENIVDWVKVKNQYRRIFDIESSNEKAVRRVAFAVATNIALRGIPANDFMTRALDPLQPKFEAEIRNVVTKRIIGRVTGRGT